jgi:methyl-accepting chemotaxis protein
VDVSVSIGKRVAALALAGAVTNGVTVFVCVVADNAMSRDSVEAGRVARVSSHTWNADMMHDSLRADVMAALAARNSSERDAFRVDDVSDHVQVLNQRLGSAQQDAPAHLRDDFAQVIPVATSYGELAVSLVRQAASDPAGARTGSAQFLSVFAELERSLGAINNTLLADVEATDKRAAETASSATRLTLGLGLLAILASSIIGWLVYQSVRRPLSQVLAQMRKMARGDADLTQRLDGGGPTELAHLSADFNQFIGRLAEVIDGVKAEAVSMAGATQQLLSNADQIQDGASGTAERVSSAAAGVEQVGANLRLFSQGTAELGQSIAEISRSASDASQIAVTAVALSQATSESIGDLGRAASEVGDVAQLIEGIAKQTNLLALNATIEAARAGAAGRGFAVVASEVKDLAQEVAEATADITARIDSIQAQTTQAVATMSDITSVVAQISQYQTSIASAVEEQTATSSDLSQAVAEAAVGGESVSVNIADLPRRAQDTTIAVGHARDATYELAQMSARLTTLMGAFRT